MWQRKFNFMTARIDQKRRIWFKSKGSDPLLVDFAASGAPIGLEILAPASVTVSQINVVLSTLGLAAISPEELAPLRAA